MLDSIYHKSFKLRKNHNFGMNMSKLYHHLPNVHKITKSVNHHFNTWRYFTHNVI